MSNRTAQPRIIATSTAVPPHVIGREDAMRTSRRIFAGRNRDFDRMLGVYANAGVESRYSCVPINWYEHQHSWPERNELFLKCALDLMEEACRAALGKANLEPEQVDAVVAVSTSGIATPSLDARLINRLGLRPDITRLPIFGFGCAGGVLGLARAAALARLSPGANILLVVVETCGLTFRASDTTKSNVIATALFGDGAAACLLRAGGQDKGEDGPVLSAWGEHTWPDSLDVMGWRVEEDGLGVVFSQTIPFLVRRDFRPALDAFLSRHGTTLAQIDGFTLHPGGEKVVSALEESLGLQQGTLISERAVLKDFGNMSAATILFVLDRQMAEGSLRGRHLLSAFGPGFTTGFAILDAA